MMIPIRRSVSALLSGAAVAAFLSAQGTEADCSLTSSNSVGSSHAAVARKLVADNVWGVVSTISLHLNGAPWGCGALVSPLNGLSQFRQQQNMAQPFNS